MEEPAHTLISTSPAAGRFQDFTGPPVADAVESPAGLAMRQRSLARRIGRMERYSNYGGR
jgi:hypothetical protein